MPRSTLETSHTLGREEAIRRLREKIDELKENYRGQFSDLWEEWGEDTLSFGFKAVGMKVAGTMAVEDSRVKVAANLPLAAMMFKGMIERQVRKELGELLA